MSTLPSDFDVSLFRPSLDSVLFFFPNLNGFRIQLRRLYNWYVVNLPSAVAHMRFPTIEAFVDYHESALVAYAHLCHTTLYNSRGLVTESPTKISLTVEPYVVSTYAMKMMREIVRPMKSESSLYVAYLPLVREGQGIVPGLGFSAGLSAMTSQSIQRGNILFEHHVCRIEHEVLLTADFMVMLEDSVSTTTKSTNMARLSACRLLRHFRPECQFVLGFSTRPVAVQAPPLAIAANTRGTWTNDLVPCVEDFVTPAVPDNSRVLVPNGQRSLNDVIQHVTGLLPDPALEAQNESTMRALIAYSSIGEVTVAQANVSGSLPDHPFTCSFRASNALGVIDDPKAIAFPSLTHDITAPKSKGTTRGRGRGRGSNSNDKGRGGQSQGQGPRRGEPKDDVPPKDIDPEPS